MTQVDFHFNMPDKLGYGCRLVRKVFRAGLGALVVCADEKQRSEFDRLLWTFSEPEFIPHVMADDELAAQTPILLAVGDTEAPSRDVLVNLGPDLPAGFSRFDRLVELVGTEPQDRSAARERWRFYRDRGYEIRNHDVAGG
jgi:DNA polymerase-3 subunit chi